MVKAVLRAELGELLKELRKRKISRVRGRLKNVCPHLTFRLNQDNEIMLQFLFLTTLEESIYRCSKCGGEAHEEFVELYREDVNQSILAGHSKRLIRRIRQSDKLREKLNTLTG